ncbi:MAG TPA: tetratricopeptide repeat protein [Bacteroidia bacterium]|nr:tetratricopeptide repeat protein [Bacteroidia bacterium]
MPACKEMSCKVGYFRCLFLSTLFLFTPYFLSAQTNKLDSLKKVFLAYHKIDTVKANLLLSICRESAYLREPRKQLDIYAPQLLALSYKLNYKKGISYALLYKGTGSYHKNKLDEERENLLQSLKMMEEMNDVSGQGFCYFELGRLFGFNNKFPEAISYYKKAIDAKNKVNDKEGMSLSYSRIGAIYDFTGDYEKAQQYLFKGLKLAEEINHINRICESYICIGIIFYEQNKFEETIQYMNKALALGDTTANKQNLMYIYNNIAIAYIGLKDDCFVIIANQIHQNAKVHR